MPVFTAPVISCVPTVGDYFELGVAKPIGLAWKPGQFVMLRAGTGGEPLLNRPFSIYREVVCEDEGWSELRFLIKIVGRGTRKLAELRTGAALEVLGPLGTAFEPPPPGVRALLVGGGVGTAPLVALALDPAFENTPKTAFVGGRTTDDLQGVDLLRLKCEEVLLTTDDGSVGEKGFVTARLEHYLDACTEPVKIHACGPEPMLKAVGALCRRRNLPCMLSLEAYMGCGWGVCLGCVTRKAEGGYLRVCREGPVVDAYKLEDYR